MLRTFSTPENLGYFALAGTLTKGAVDFLVVGLSAVLLPAMSRTYGSGQGRALANMLAEAIRFYWYLGLLISGIGILVSGDIVTLLYGARYTAAIPAVMVKIVVVAIAGVSAFLNSIARSKTGLAVFGALSALGSLGAVFLGVLLG